MLIGQKIGLKFLVPLALQYLKKDPLVQGDFYPGDLLCSVLQVNSDFWEKNKKMYQEIGLIAGKARSLAVGHSKVVIRAIEEAVAAFSLSMKGKNR